MTVIFRNGTNEPVYVKASYSQWNAVLVGAAAMAFGVIMDGGLDGGGLDGTAGGDMMHVPGGGPDMSSASFLQYAQQVTPELWDVVSAGVQSGSVTAVLNAAWAAQDFTLLGPGSTLEVRFRLPGLKSVEMRRVRNAGRSSEVHYHNFTVFFGSWFDKRIDLRDKVGEMELVTRVQHTHAD